MKLRVEAAPGEIRAKGRDLVSALADRVSEHDGELADALRKSLVEIPPRAPSQKFRFLQNTQDEAKSRYEARMREMIEAVASIVAEAVAHSEPLQPEEARPEQGLEPKAFVDHSKISAEVDQREIDEIRQALIKTGLFSESSFAAGGELAKATLSQLRDRLAASIEVRDADR